MVICQELAVPALADSKTATGYKLFTGGAGDACLLNSWPIHFLITDNYINNGSDCKLDSVQISAYMEQKIYLQVMAVLIVLYMKLSIMGQPYQEHFG